MKITPSSTGKELESLALTIHKLVNELPVTMRTRNSNGIRLEDGIAVDYDYTGPILEKVLDIGKKCSETPVNGPYKGIPVLVVPLIENDEVIAAIGVVDITKGIYSDLIEITKRPASRESKTLKEENP